MPFRHRALFGLGSLLLTAACATAGPPESEEAEAPGGSPATTAAHALIEGVVVDAASEAAYTMRTGGGIEAIALADGEVLWSTHAADLPLHAAGGVLAAQVERAAHGEMVVALLDASTGQPIAAAEEPIRLALPKGVVATIDQTLALSFERATLTHDGELFLTWEFMERDVLGMAPPGGRALARRETGAFRFRPELPGFEVVDASALAEPGRDWPPELAELIRTRQVLRPPWRTGEHLAIAQQRYDPDELVLRRWGVGEGEERPERVLHAGRAAATLASCDERHVVVAVPGPDPASGLAYRLRYSSLDTGDPLLEIFSERSVGPFCLVGARLLGVSQPVTRRVDGELRQSPLELVAFELSTGVEVWRREIRDTAFRGPLPPQR